MDIIMMDMTMTKYKVILSTLVFESIIQDNNINEYNYI